MKKRKKKKKLVKILASRPLLVFFVSFTFLLILYIQPSREPLLISYDNTGQALPVKLENLSFKNWPKCQNPSNYTYYIKSHFIKGEQRRNWIRNSWGKGQKLIFISFGGFGNEGGSYPRDYGYNDMLIIDKIYEKREYLSFKITVGLFHAKTCQQSSENHIIVTDDDIYFWREKLESDIDKIWNFETIEARGHVRYFDSPVRPNTFIDNKINPIFNPTITRYGISKEMFHPDKLPPYFIGAGYIISYKAVSKIGMNLNKTRLLWQVDDAYVGMLLHDSKVKIVDDDKFLSFEEHKLIKSSKSVNGIPFQINVFGKDYYSCDIYNFHGYKVDEIFNEIKNEKCEGNKYFRIDKRVLEEFKMKF